MEKNSIGVQTTGTNGDALKDYVMNAHGRVMDIFIKTIEDHL